MDGVLEVVGRRGLRAFNRPALRECRGPLPVFAFLATPSLFPTSTGMRGYAILDTPKTDEIWSQPT